MNNPELIKTLKRLGWISGLFFALIMIISAVERKQGSVANAVDIHIEKLPGGYLLINDGDVRALINRSFGFDLEGQKLSTINVNRVERVLEDDPFVLNADVHVNAKNEVKIDVWQREPLLRIKDNNGLNYYIDVDGKKLPLSKHFTARLLVATGNIPPHVPDFLEREHHLLKDLYKLTNLILAEEFWRSMFEQVHVFSGEFTLIPKVGNQKIKFGGIEDAEGKLRRLRIFYEEGVPYEGWQKYRTLDLRFDGQVVCERR